MTTIIGLDGQSREWSEVFGSDCWMDSMATISGYIVRQWAGEPGAQEDIAQFDGADSYGAAIDAKRAAMATFRKTGISGNALIDTLYESGRRGAA